MSNPEQLSVLNEEYKILPGSQSLHKLIRWDRDSCALDFLLNESGQRRTYSYRELRKCVLSTVSAVRKIYTAQNIKKQGSHRIIPVLLPQSPALYIAILAVLEAGAAFCPLNLDAPLDRVQFVVGDVSAEVVVTCREYEHLFKWDGGPNILLIDEIHLAYDGNNNNLRSNTCPSTPPHDLAYVMYTSGSTGTPKGVSISHLAVSQSLLAHDKHIPPFSRFLQFASPSFDVSVFEIFFPLFRGATLVGCTRSQMLNDLVGVINSLDIDALELTPTVVSSLVQNRSKVPGLKLLLTIGEMLTRPVVDSFGNSNEADGVLYAMYGPTETAIHCTVNPRMEIGSPVADIGVPLDTVSAFVISPEESSNAAAKVNPLPIGEVGELVIGGPQLADEYLNRKEQNETAFVSIRGQRAYRTGDRARITSKGRIEILGRVSSGQVKIRGQRVELGEIEDAIYRHPHVKIVSVIILRSTLIAFVITKERKLKTQDLVQACSKWLPSFMIPNEFVVLDAFPYLPSGKVDKRKLEADFESRRIDEINAKVQWNSPTENIVGHILQELLGFNVSVNARLATYGLDSLAAIRLGSRLRSAGFHVSPVNILKVDDLESLAHVCENSKYNNRTEVLPLGHFKSEFDDVWVEQVSKIEGIKQRDVEYFMPCTPMQDAMLSETAIDGLAYKNKIVLEISPYLSADQLNGALKVLLQNTPILRSSFIESPSNKSTYLQAISKNLPSSQIEIMKDSFNDSLKSLQISLLHPLHIQIYHSDSRSQVLFQMHHALYDAWSIELIVDDLETILHGNQLPMRPPFENVVRYHFGNGEAESTWPSKVYWKGYLSHFNNTPLPNFTTLLNEDRGLHTSTFKTSIATRDLVSAARTLGVSSQSLFQAAYALVLSSYLGTRDVCFGTVFSGRTSSITGIEDVIGPCLTTVPIRVDTTTASTIADLTRALNLANRKHLDHGSLPLREIKKACGVSPGQPLFDSLLVWQQTLHDYTHKRDYVKIIDTSDYLEFNLTLEISPTAGNIFVKANYRRSVFPLQQIDILLQQLDQLVAEIISKPGTPLPLSNDIFSNDLLSIENIDPVTTLFPGSLTSSVEHMAVEFPEKHAIEFANSIGDDHLDFVGVSYAELNSQANQIAHYLVAHNIQPDELVCVCMEKSPQLYISILAICKAGAAYAPLTPNIPPERFQHIISDANIKLVLTHSSAVANLETFHSVQFVPVDKMDFSTLPSKNPLIKFKPDNLAYCVFTSGSTGTPKGVLVTQGNLLSNLQVLAELYPYTHQSKFLQSCSQAFDVSVFEIFFAWHIGSCLCSAVNDVLFRDIELAIRAMNITHLSLTPTVAALISPDNVSKVEFLVTAGEAVTPKVFNIWANHGLYQGYGPSETTNICSVRPKVTEYHSISNIGPPLKNTSVFVLSPGETFTLVPRGGEGEFCFGGTQVGRGYLDPNQDVNKFIQHPKYGKLYRSGDYGRLLPDGSLHFSGRKDDQVKLRGQRIELGEINSVLLGSPDVIDCIGLIIEKSRGTEQHLVCFWTPAGSTSREFTGLEPNYSIIEGLFQSLAQALPTYMVPSMLIPVSCLPSTSQGKIDKRRLESHYRSLGLEYLNQVCRTEKVMPNHIWTELEEQVARRVSEIVKVPTNEIGPDTSFFSLGIDSLSAISLSRLMREKERIMVDISEILKYPSVSRLAGHIGQRFLLKEGTAPSDLIEFNFDPAFLRATMQSFENAGRSVERILPCTPLQEAMLSASEASTDAYDNRLVLKINVSVKAFQRVWTEMIKRHEILRTCFIRISNPQFAYAQVVLSNFDLDWEMSGRAEVDAVRCDTTAGDNRTEFNPPYNLRFRNIHKTPELELSMHHAIYDGFAISILFEEIQRLLQNLTLTSRVSFVPFLQYMSSLGFAEADEYWIKLLAEFSPSQFPQSVEKPNDFESRETSALKVSSENSFSWVDSQIKAFEISLLSAIQTIWASTLSGLFNTADVCFGNVVSGRTVPVGNVDRLVAPCFNTIPVRIKDMDRLTYFEAFRILQMQNADSLKFQLTPLRRIQAHRNRECGRIFETLLIVQKPSRPLDSSIWSIVEENGKMDLPLVLEVVPETESDKIQLILHTHRIHISDAVAADVLKIFDAKFKMALENPRHPMISGSRVCSLNRSKRTIDKIAGSAIEVLENHDSYDELSTMETTIRDIISLFTDFPKESIQRNTNIFRLGLDSISSVQVAAELRKQGCIIKGSDVLQHPSIAQLARRLENGRVALETASEAYDFKSFDQKYREFICSKLNRPTRTIAAIRPCTLVQCGMLAQSLHRHGSEYINSLFFQLVPGTSLSKIRSAWETCMQCNEMLRTGFVEIDDPNSPFAMVTYEAESSSLPWTADAKGLPNDSSDFEHQNMLDALATCPWNLKVIKEGSVTLLKFTAHHALYDAQSLELILDEVARNYLEGRTADYLSINPILSAILTAQYRDEVSRKKYWQDDNKIRINRFPDLTPLRQSTTKCVAEEKISALSVAQLEKLCRDHNITIQAAGQAAWARILSCYVGESSVTFGLTLSGRAISQNSEKYAFPTIVTLPVCCDLDGTNFDLLQHIMSSNSQLHEHQYTPLTTIQKWVGRPEGKLFDTLFAYQKINRKAEAVERPWMIVREEASADYTVSMELQPTENGSVQLRLTFKESIVPAQQARLILNQYDALLQDTLQNAKGLSKAIPDLSHDLISITPASQPTLPSPVKLLHEFVESQIKLIPQKIAFEFTTDQGAGDLITTAWNFAQLDKEGNKVANLLLSRGAKNGDLIAICFDKCPAASFAILGILKAGCAYVALDPSAPPDRLKFIVTDSRSNLILSIGEVAQTLSEVFAESLAQDRSIGVLDIGDVRLSRNTMANKPKLARPIEPEDTCYCLYTSGTTGTPKGCEITHENAVQAMMSFQKLFEGHWTEESKWFQFASFHFDVSVLEQFWSWSVGICVASAPRDLIFEDIPGMIRKLGITHIDLTPSLARLIHPNDVPSLTKGVFITGGEQLRQEILDAWGDCECIYNGYGPTEATIGVTMYPRVPKNGKPSNIGPQFQNVGTYVFKLGTTQPVLRGAVGELCVSGKLLGRGYLNRPELTKERFPYLENFGERVYRTGDLVRILHDGSFLFLGRADDQVKLRGQRLELNEINEVIKMGAGDIQDVVTLVLKHNRQQREQLVTFFVPSAVRRITNSNEELANSIRAVCKGRLPGYMVPTYFIPLEKLPLSSNNKADFKELGNLLNSMSIEDLQSLDSAGKVNQIWTAKEKSVIEILASCMKVETATLANSSNIFELGIDSISVIGLARNLQQAGFKNASLSTVMKNTSIDSLVKILALDEKKTVDNISNFLEASQRIAAFMHKLLLPIADELGIEASDIECLAPCTPAQEGMVYKYLRSNNPLYFATFNYALNDTVDEDELRAAWERVALHLQVLRTKFVLTSDGCAQIVLNDSALPWKPLSLKSKERKSTMQKRIGQEFEFSKVGKITALANPYSISIIHSEKKRIMSLRIFHGIYDGISLQLLLHKVREEYHNKPSIDYGPSFHQVIPYGPLARCANAEAFWRNALRDHAYHALPRLRSSPNFSGSRDATITRSIPALEIQHLIALRNRLGITHQAILLTAWSSVLAEILNSSSASSFFLTQGIILSGRSFCLPSSKEKSSSNAQDTIGPLLNTIPFHINITDGMSWRELLRICHAFGTQIVADGLVHTPLRDVLRWNSSGKQRELFDTLFVFQYEGPTQEQGQESLWTELPGEAIADYPLAFEAQLNNNGDVVMTLVGQADFLDDVTATEILMKVEKALNELKFPDQLVTGLKMQGRSKKHRTTDLGPQKEPARQTEAKDFVWTPEARFLRAEIELLSGTSSTNEHSSIFSLGLDSIDVIKLVSRLQKRSIQISVSSILKCQSIASMVNELSTNKSSVDKTKTTKNEYRLNLMTNLKESGKLPENAIEVLPATPLQEGLVAEMISSRYMRYFNHDIFRVSNHVDMQRLMEAWDSVVMKNGIFRTRFIEIDDVELPMTFAQVLCHPTESVWHRLELSSSTDLQDKITTAIERAIEMARKGSLLHLQTIRHGESRYFVLSIAHALYDGWSMRSLHQDISATYHGNPVDRPDPNPTLELMLNSESLEAERFWKSSLHGLQKSKFPERASQGRTDAEIVHRRERTSCHPLKAILEFCKTISITLQTLGQTAWAVVLATYLRQLDVVFGVVLSCRDTEEANELMFPLMNTVAVRSVLHGSLSELLIYMQDMSNSIRRFQHYPLRKAQSLAGIRDGSLFDTLFIYQGRTSQTIPVVDKLYQSVENVAEVEFAISVEMEIIDDDLVWRTAVKNSVLTGTETDNLLDRLDEVVGTLINDSKMSTISSSPDGISVCGLQGFEHESSKATGDVTMPIADHLETLWTPTEIKIRAALSQVSKVPEKDIDQYQTIFHLGLDSISAIKVSSILRRDNVRLSVNDIVRQSNVFNMANLVQNSDKRILGKRYDIDKIIGDSMKHIKLDKIMRRAAVKSENVQEILPVTAGQLYMLARWQASAGALFVGSFEYHVVGSLNASRLETAWKALLAKHSILRTIFLLLDREKPTAIQIILEDVENDIKWPSASTAVDHISLKSPLSLSVKKRGVDEFLCLQIHHALYDGVSLPLLINDLQALYVQTPADHSLDSGFRRFVALTCNGDDGIVKHQMEFWKSYLDESTLLYIENVGSNEGSRIEVFEPGNRIKIVPVLAQKNGVSVDAVLLAAVAKVYRNMLNVGKENYNQVKGCIKSKEDVIFGLYLANRAVYDEDLSFLVAPTLNFLPIRISPVGSLAQIAQRIQFDLQKLSSAEIAGSSLASIYDWTGVHVDCFINILKPLGNDINIREGQTKFLENSEGRSRQRRADVIELQSDTQLNAISIEKSPNFLHEAYLPSLDIEMRVTDEGASLDIGVFAPRQYMTLEDATELVDSITAQLRQVE